MPSKPAAVVSSDVIVNNQFSSAAGFLLLLQPPALYQTRGLFFDPLSKSENVICTARPTQAPRALLAVISAVLSAGLIGKLIWTSPRGYEAL